MDSRRKQDLVKPKILKKKITENSDLDGSPCPQPSVILPSTSWLRGSRRSAFQPYRPSSTPVLTNLQRGNTENIDGAPSDVSEPGWHMAAGMGDLTLSQISLEKDVDVKDENGMTALIWAATYGQLPTIERLVKAGADVNNVCSKGYSPLLLASYNGHYEVVRFLLAAGANVNHREQKGNTALMYAAYSNCPHVVNELLLRGANILLENNEGETSYSVAVKRKSRSAQSVLDMYLITLLTK